MRFLSPYVSLLFRATAIGPELEKEKERKTEGEEGRRVGQARMRKFGPQKELF